PRSRSLVLAAGAHWGLGAAGRASRPYPRDTGNGVGRRSEDCLMPSASNFSQRSPPLADRADGFTGDPRVRDIWERSRHERHVIIRSMWGDPWAEASWPTSIGQVLSHGFLWVIGVPFTWAALVMISFFATAIFLTFYDKQAPVEQYLGRGFDGGVG